MKNKTIKTMGIGAAVLMILILFAPVTLGLNLNPETREHDGYGITPPSQKQAIPQDDVDSDGDRLTDAEEKEYGTNPYLSDSDGDGLCDDDEIGYGTDPFNPDTDSDGIKDGYEVSILRSNPLFFDVFPREHTKLNYGMIRAGVAEGAVRSDMNITLPSSALGKRG